MRPSFFPKMPLRFPDFIIRNGVFLCYKVKNGVTDFSGFFNPETSKIRCVNDVFGLHNPETL